MIIRHARYRRPDVAAAARPAPPCASATTAARRRSCSTPPASSPAQGYDQTSVPQLADELGLAAGGLYHYFGSKEQLLIAICDQLMDPLLDERARDRRRRRRSGGAAPRARPPVGRPRRSSTATTCSSSSRSATSSSAATSGAASASAARQFERLVEAVLERVQRDGDAAPRRPRGSRSRAAGHGQPHRPVVPAARPPERRARSPTATSSSSSRAERAAPEPQPSPRA